MPELALAVNNAFAAKYWPEPDAWTRLVAERIGLGEVQHSFDLMDPLLPRRVLDDLVNQTIQQTAAHGLMLGTTFTGAVAYAQSLLGHPNAGVQDHARSWYRAAIDVTSQLGAQATGGHIGTSSHFTHTDPVRRREYHRRLLAEIRGLADYAAKNGHQRFLWELMPSALEPPHHPQEAARLLEAVNSNSPIPIELCLDLGHCCAPTLTTPGDPVSWLGQLLPWIGMVHLQQTDGRHDRHWPFSSRYRHDGIIDPSQVLGVLADSPKRRVDLVFEFVHSMTAPPEQVLADYEESVAVWATEMSL